MCLLLLAAPVRPTQPLPPLLLLLLPLRLRSDRRLRQIHHHRYTVEKKENKKKQKTHQHLKGYAQEAAHGGKVLFQRVVDVNEHHISGRHPHTIAIRTYHLLQAKNAHVQKSALIAFAYQLHYILVKMQ